MLTEPYGVVFTFAMFEFGSYVDVVVVMPRVLQWEDLNAPLERVSELPCSQDRSVYCQEASHHSIQLPPVHAFLYICILLFIDSLLFINLGKTIARFAHLYSCAYSVHDCTNLNFYV